MNKTCLWCKYFRPLTGHENKYGYCARDSGTPIWTGNEVRAVLPIMKTDDTCIRFVEYHVRPAPLPEGETD